MIEKLASLSGAVVPGSAAGTNADRAAKLKSAAQAFEAVFLRQMIGSMREANLGDGLFDSDATKQFQDMADARTADAMASHGVLGIAQMIEKQLGPIAGLVTGAAKDAASHGLADGATTAAAGASTP